MDIIVFYVVTIIVFKHGLNLSDVGANGDKHLKYDLKIIKSNLLTSSAAKAA